MNNLITRKFKTQKTNLHEFSQYLKNNYSSIKDWMTRVLNNSTFDNLNKRIRLLRNTIINVSN
jgi:hypothetical protein